MNLNKWIRSSFRHRLFAATMVSVLLPVLLCSVLVFTVSLRQSRLFLREHAESDLSDVADAVTGFSRDLSEAQDFLQKSTLVRSTLRYEAWNSNALYSVLLKKTHSLRRYADFSILDKNGTVRFTTASASPAAPETLPLDWGILRLAREHHRMTVNEASASAEDTGSAAAQLSDQPNGSAAAGNSPPSLHSAENYVTGAGEDGGLEQAVLLTSYDGEELGYILIRSSIDQMSALLTGTYSAGSDVFLLDSSWRLIYSSQRPADDVLINRLRSAYLRSEADESRPYDLDPAGSYTNSYNYTVAGIAPSGITAVLQQPKLFTTAVTRTLILISVSIALTGLLLGLFTTWKLSRHISEPILDLDRAMKQAMNGDYSVRIASSRTDEMGHLTRSFNHMLEEHALNLRRSVKRQKELNETQIRMLQAQLNPHFLYNTLDTLKWLGVSHGVPDIAALSTSLAALLRASISDSRLITLDEELDLVERYLSIQSIRFEDRFTCEIDVDERFRSCLIPKLVLQPVVENAVVHGVADMDEGYIKITAEEKFEDASRHVLVLTVSDNGTGMPAETLNVINSGGSLKPRGHLGCYNVGKIIRLYYGESYGLYAASSPGRGTVITLRLPLKISDPAGETGPHIYPE